MNNIRRAAAFILVFSLTPAIAAELALKPGSRLWLEGDSTLHAYASTATMVQVTGWISPGSGDQELSALARAGRVKDLTVAIPVQGLKSGESRLDKNMRAALKAENFPRIEFQMTDYSAGPTASDGTFTVEARGRLSIAGKTDIIAIKTLAREDGGNLKIGGEHKLSMSAFGIKPPSLMLGALKVRDAVVVHYELILGSP